MTESQTPLEVIPNYEQSVEERNAWLDACVDPKHKLPTVELIDLNQDGGMAIKATHPKWGLVSAGFVSFQASRTELPDAASIDFIELDDGFRGKGYGTATYLALMKSLPIGQAMKSSPILSPYSYAVWRGLEARGVVMSNQTDSEVKFRGPNGRNGTSDVNFCTAFGTSKDSWAITRKRNGELMPQLSDKNRISAKIAGLFKRNRLHR